jgi:hypothetical protein
VSDAPSVVMEEADEYNDYVVMLWDGALCRQNTSDYRGYNGYTAYYGRAKDVRMTESNYLISTNSLQQAFQVHGLLTAQLRAMELLGLTTVIVNTGER